MLEPFGASPRLTAEAARAGYRVLAAVNNPIARFLLELHANPPSESELRTALADLAVADPPLQALWVLAQNATVHSLDPPVKDALPASPTDLAVGDFGSDGLLDLAAVSFSPCCVTELAQSPASHLLSSVSGYPLVSSSAESIAAADIDGDSPS